MRLGLKIKGQGSSIVMLAIVASHSELLSGNSKQHIY